MVRFVKPFWKRTMTEQEIYQAALDKWGRGVQMGMAMSEAGELTAALGRMAVQGRSNREEVIGELADMEIMLGQMRLLFGDEDIDAEKRRKLERLAGIINGSVEHPHG